MAIEKQLSQQKKTVVPFYEPSDWALATWDRVWVNWIHCFLFAIPLNCYECEGIKTKLDKSSFSNSGGLFKSRIWFPHRAANADTRKGDKRPLTVINAPISFATVKPYERLVTMRSTDLVRPIVRPDVGRQCFLFICENCVLHSIVYGGFQSFFMGRRLSPASSSPIIRDHKEGMTTTSISRKHICETGVRSLWIFGWILYPATPRHTRPRLKGDNYVP